MSDSERIEELCRAARKMAGITGGPRAWIGRDRATKVLRALAACTGDEEEAWAAAVGLFTWMDRDAEARAAFRVRWGRIVRGEVAPPLYRVYGVKQAADAEGGGPLEFACEDGLLAWAGREGEVYTGRTPAGAEKTVLRAELRDQPLLRGLAGPMWDGETDEGNPVVRYETWELYEVLST